MPESGAGARPLAEPVPTHQPTEQNRALLALAGALSLEALQERTEAIVARESGGPCASGLKPAVLRAQVAHELIQNVILGVENPFAKHGKKALRANCGGKLAKDET
mmetsp:Transcript_71955/g.197040  ORF Transcript_71955/g.197040 Transcript_71955/m.197040 type:complete len:106 (-) Transcript_71955:299-616(-)